MLYEEKGTLVTTDIRAWLASGPAWFGPWGPFVAGVLDSAFLPLGQSVDVLIVAQAAMSPQMAYLGASLATAGSTLGSLILYYFARRAGGPLLEKTMQRARVEKIRGRFEKLDAFVLLLPTALPLPLPVRPLVIAAGVFRMNLWRFIGVIAFARGVRYLGIAFLTVHYSESGLAFLGQHALTGLLVAAASAAVFLIIRRCRDRRFTQPATTNLSAAEAERA